MRDSVIIERVIRAPIDRVFKAYITPEDLMQWHNAGEGWKTPYAEVDAKVGGKMKIAYADPNGTVVFEFTAIISEFEPPKRLAYYLTINETAKQDDRLVTVDFDEVESGTKVRLEFDIEHKNDRELQRGGWTNHIDNLQKLLETIA